MSRSRRDLLQPPAALQERLADRIAADTGSVRVPPPALQWREPQWREAAPGVSYKLLAVDVEGGRLSLLVRLAPGAAYPPHTHAGTEELHLLDGELWIDDGKLVAGDYRRSLSGSSDQRVWSETGCTCALITSAQDVIG